LQSDNLKHINRDVRGAIRFPNSKQTKIDNYTLLVPAVSVYALNAAGIKGRHSFRDRTIILATASAIVYSTVLGLKSASGVERPDGSTEDSFPSGHTATAFVGAEFFLQEYKDQSVWYGVGGYIIATGTAFLRMANDRHWLTDVAAGAGIGIISTKFAYWINPIITETFFSSEKNNPKTSAVIAPFYNGKQTGVIAVVAF
jgi:hypothetical protein